MKIAMGKRKKAKKHKREVSSSEENIQPTSKSHHHRKKRKTHRNADASSTEYNSFEEETVGDNKKNERSKRLAELEKSLAKYKNAKTLADVKSESREKRHNKSSFPPSFKRNKSLTLGAVDQHDAPISMSNNSNINVPLGKKPRDDFKNDFENTDQPKKKRSRSRSRSMPPVQSMHSTVTLLPPYNVLPQNAGVEKHNDEEISSLNKSISSRKFRSELTRLLCCLYGLAIVIAGFVLPLGSVLTHKGFFGAEHYLDIFQLYVYVTSILFLFYLHMCLLCDNPKNKRRFWDSVASSSVTNFSNFFANYNNSKAEASNRNNNSKNEDTVSESTDVVNKNNSNLPKRSPTESNSDVTIKPFVYNGSDGMNFYLGLGAVAFAACSMTYDGFKIAQVFELDKYGLHCYGDLYTATAVVHLIFTFIQTYFIFKNDKLVINMTKALVRFGLVHLIATNFSVWAVTVITEVTEDVKLNNLEWYQMVNETTIYPENIEKQMCDTKTHSLARSSSRYLFPCTIQYSLIAAAVIYKIFSNVGAKGECEDKHLLCTTEPVCYKAHRGLFLGLMTAVITIVLLSLSFVFKSQREIAAQIIIVLEIFLLSVASIASIIGFARIHKLPFKGMKIGPDAMLLILSLFGMLMLNIFILVASSGTLYSGTGNQVLASLTLLTCLLGLLQAILQTVLDGQGRSADQHKHVKVKPGRTIITFLLMCNISLLIVNSFEMQKADNYSINTNYYGKLAWSIVSHFCIPLILFFRFQSSVSLSEIWREAYKIQEV